MFGGVPYGEPTGRVANGGVRGSDFGVPFLLLLFERFGDFGRKLSISGVSGTKFALLFGKRSDHCLLSNISTPSGGLYVSLLDPFMPTVSHPLRAFSGSPKRHNLLVPKQNVSISAISSDGLPISGLDSTRFFTLTYDLLTRR